MSAGEFIQTDRCYVWEDPPPRKWDVLKWDAVAADLRDNPDQWVRLIETDGIPVDQFSKNVMSAHYGSFRPAGAFQVTVRQRSVYVRFVGTDDSLGRTPKP